VLVLDDSRVIGKPTVHGTVAFLLDDLPPQVTLGITMRADALLSTSRLRARGQLLE
jgi:LuxR family maltose regulon positive regulatory protein